MQRLFLLNRVIEEEAYVEQPQGFEVYQKKTHVCRWKKTLYGFKQLGADPLMYNNRSVVKTSCDREVYRNGSSEVWGNGLQIHGKLP
jgi:hypothetical protein